jgi:hypothetical protein
LTISLTTFRRLTIPFSAALLLLVAACSSSNKNNKPVTPSATSAATVARTQPPAASAAGTAAATPSGGVAIGGTPQAGGTPAPSSVDVARRLEPLLFQTAQLPQGESDFQSGPPIPVGNDNMGTGRPDANALTQQYNQAGRLGGVAGGWAKPGGQVTPQTKSPYLINCILSEYPDATAAQRGLAVSVQQVRSTPSQQGATKTTTGDLQAAQLGSGATAFRQDQAVQSSLNGQLFTTHVVTYLQVWQQGTVVAQCQFSAINEDPVLADFQQIVRAQESDLQQGGF